MTPNTRSVVALLIAFGVVMLLAAWWMSSAPAHAEPLLDPLKRRLWPSYYAQPVEAPTVITAPDGTKVTIIGAQSVQVEKPEVAPVEIPEPKRQRGKKQ